MLVPSGSTLPVSSPEVIARAHRDASVLPVTLNANSRKNVAEGCTEVRVALSCVPALAHDFCPGGRSSGLGPLARGARVCPRSLGSQPHVARALRTHARVSQPGSVIACVSHLRACRPLDPVGSAHGRSDAPSRVYPVRRVRQSGPGLRPGACRVCPRYHLLHPSRRGVINSPVLHKFCVKYFMLKWP